MQIVIDIPNSIYANLSKIVNGSIASKRILDCVKNGTPHESVTEFADRCRECGREKVLDKIRTEIESCREDEEPHLCDYRHHRNEGLDMALDIIDKYKAESEE